MFSLLSLRTELKFKLGKKVWKWPRNKLNTTSRSPNKCTIIRSLRNTMIKFLPAKISSITWTTILEANHLSRMIGMVTVRVVE